MTEKVAQKEKASRGWYSVSVAAVQRMFTFVGLVIAIGIGFLVYQRWETYAMEGQARRVIDDAAALISRIENGPDAPTIKRDHKAAWDLHGEASAAFGAGNFARALERGEHSLVILKTVFDKGGQGSIRVLSVSGSVEYRRGERGSWKRARIHDTLNPGDWVKTSTAGTAELLFADGSVFTLRQSTLVHLGGSQGGATDRSTDIAFGRVELNTSDGDRTVTTPRSEARVRGDSEALVAFDRDRGSARFAAYSGGVEIRSESGQVRQIGALQQVEQQEDKLQEIKSLPGKPLLATPVNDFAIDFDANREVQLAWQEARNARSYVLQISSSRLFARNYIDDQRGKTSARVGIRGEGTFFWQVAAVDRNGVRGPWSEARSFRVASLRSIGEVNDSTPPTLEIVGTETYGNLVIVNGRTESGAAVTINGEEVALKTDGSFSKTIQMNQEGWGVVEIVATDAWNNQAVEKTRVFIDAI